MSPSPAPTDVPCMEASPRMSPHVPVKMSHGGSIMNGSHTHRHRVALGALVVGLAGCYHSTHLANTWRDPTAGPLHFQKTVVAFATTDESLRRTVEDRLAA